MDTFSINIVGYWRDIHKNGVPTHSGIFFVYEDQYNKELGTVTLKQILYVGEADNVRERIATHPLRGKWQEAVERGNELCYSTCIVPAVAKTQIKAAFIFKLQPKINIGFKDAFLYPKTTVISTGKTSLIETNFMLEGTGESTK